MVADWSWDWWFFGVVWTYLIWHFGDDIIETVRLYIDRKYPVKEEEDGN